MAAGRALLLTSRTVPKSGTHVSTQFQETGERLVQETPLKIPEQETLGKRLGVQQKSRDKWSVTSARHWITELKGKKKNQEQK